MKQVRNLKERICALILAVVLLLTSWLPDMAMATVQAAEGETRKVEIQAQELMEDGVTSVNLSGASVTIYAGEAVIGNLTTDNEGKTGEYTVENYDSTINYTYTVEKTGFETKSSQSLEVADTSTDLKTNIVQMTMNPIELSQNELEVNLTDGSVDLNTYLSNKVENQNASEPGYRWSVTGGSLSVEETTGAATLSAKGESKVTVSRNGKTAQMKVKVYGSLGTSVGLTVNPEEGNNITSLTFALTGMPADAAAEVPVYIDTIESEPVATIRNDGSGNWTGTAAISDLKGTHNFIAVYPKDSTGYYASQEIRIDGKNYKADTTVTIDKETMVYGEDAPVITVVNAEGRTITYTSTNTETAAIDEQGIITINGAGTTTIQATSAEDENYTALDQSFTLEVTPKEITINTITWGSVTKIYDGTKSVVLSGTATGAGIKEGDVIAFTAEAELTDVNVGTYKEAKLVDTPKTEDSNYTITFGESLQTDKTLEDNLEVVVNKRPLYVKVVKNDPAYKAEVQYGDVTEDTIKDIIENYKIAPVEADASAEEGIVEADKENTEILSNITVVKNTDGEGILTEQTEQPYVGVYSRALRADIPTDAANLPKNYEIRFNKEKVDDSEEYGQINVVQEVTTDKEFWGKVNVSKMSRKKVYGDYRGIWVNASDTLVFTCVDENYTDIVVNGNNNELSYGDVLATENDGGKNVSIYAKHSGNADTRTTSDAENNSVDNHITIKLDDKRPTVEFSSLQPKDMWAVNDINFAFTNFTGFDKNERIESITIKDNESGCDPENQTYNLLEIPYSEDVNVTEKIKETAYSKDTGWNALENGTIVVPDNDKEGYYVILVKAVDNAGNEAVYASNGMVMDIGAPYINLNITSENCQNGIYTGDVDYAIEVTDPEKTNEEDEDVNFSGISKIEVTVTANPTVTEEGKTIYQNSNSYTLDETELNKIAEVTSTGSYTFKDLKEKSYYTIYGRVCGEDFNSNSVKVTVQAMDKAGNMAAEKEVALKIDNTKPTIESITYDKPTTDSNCYTERTMTIQYKERNFDENLAKFVIKEDGESSDEQTLSLSDLISNPKEGITVQKVEDTQDIPEDVADTSCWTDDRLVTYSLKFSGQENEEIVYSILPSISDLAGNELETPVQEQSFTIDRKKPEIKVEYDNNNVSNGKYYNEIRNMTVTITEHNYDESLVKFIINEKEITLESLKKQKDSENEIEYVSEDNSKKDEHCYKFKLGADKKDIDYSITPDVTDKAGNILDKPEEQIFTIDMVKPIVAVKYFDGEKNITDNIKEDPNELNWYYSKKTITAKITVTERNFAQEGTFSKEPVQMNLVYTAQDSKGQKVKTVPDYQENAESLSNWTPENADKHTVSFEFKEEANYSLQFAYTDLAGNSAEIYDTHYFTVDHTPPTGQITLKEESDLGSKLIDALTTLTFGKPIDALTTITFGIFKKEKTTVTFTSKDAVSPYMQGYKMYDPEGIIKGEISQLEIVGDADTAPDDVTLMTLENSEIKDWIGEKKYTKEEKSQTAYVELNTENIPYMRLQDKAGNVAFYSREGIIVDDQNPEKIDITITTEAPSTGITDNGKKIYNGDVAFNISVTDPKKGNTYAGLSSVTYKVLADGKETQKTVKYEETVEPLPAINRVQTVNWTQDSVTKPVVEAGKNNSNNVVIEVTACDNAGNKVTETEELAIDITEPKIQVSYDNNDAANGSYFKKDRVMTITYIERNFFEKGLSFDVTLDGIERKGISMDELKTLEGITVESGPVDSQEGVASEDLTDERTNAYEIYFGEKDKKIDKDYVIIPHIQDKAALVNTASAEYVEGTQAGISFTIDEIAPLLQVEYKADGRKVKPGTDEAGRIFESVSKITADVEIQERNFSAENKFSEEPKQMQVDYTALNSKSENVKTEDYGKSADSRNSWKTDGTVRTKTFVFSEDANYTFNLKYKDLAGNEAVSGIRYFTVDDTKPTGSVYTKSNTYEQIWYKFLETITFGFFNQNAQEVKLTSEDETAGVKSTQYYKYIPDTESRNAFKALTVEQLDGITEWTDGFSVMVNQEEQAIIYEKVVDYAGNRTYINTQEGVIVDSTAPTEPEIAIKTAEPIQGIYAGNVDFTIQVTDPVSGKTYAGLKEVYYEVRNNGTVTQSGNYNAELADHTARRKSITKHETIDAQINNSNFVQIYVKAVDYAGNESEAVRDVKIDITAPEVTITFDNNNPLNGKYYNVTRTATVSVRERNFDANAVHFTIANTDGTQPSVSGWSSDANAGVSDDAVNTCTVTFAADGDYTMSMDCADLAGNTSNTATVEEFTIDKTVPTIQVGFDNNNASNGRYYNAPRTATITVNEHNFNGSEVQTAINAALQSQGITAPGVNGWSANGDTHTATVYFGTDGDYSFTVNYSDLAGNAAQAYSVDLFTVDQTKPVIEIFDIENKSANNGEVAPGVRYSDVNYDISGVSITIKGPKHQETAIDGARSSIPNGESIKMADFAHEESVDDVYTLTAKVTDFAGNADEQQVVFSVNRFGSNFIFGDATKKFLDKYYSNKEQDLIVTEINVDTLEHYGISYGHDGELVNLEQKKDYTVKESGSEATWKSYTYTIAAENFEQEGLYNITIDSRDRATNEVNNKVKNAEIEFVIDKTAPTVVITGIENDKQYRAADRDVMIAVSDNVAVGGMDVYVDDREKPVESYDAKTIIKQKGEIPFTLGSSSKWQKISAVAADAAGNIAETSEYRVLITSNLFVQFYRNTPLVVTSSVGIAAVIAFLILLLAKRRKKEEEAQG